MHDFRAVAAGLGILLAPSLALAHAQLRGAEPRVGSTIHAAPAQVELTFSEGVEPRFTTATVADAAGVQVDKHDLHAVPGDPQRVVVGLWPLQPGTYTVVWHATSVDTHKTEGTFTFTLAP